jgi:hypothetical protein
MENIFYFFRILNRIELFLRACICFLHHNPAARSLELKTSSPAAVWWLFWDSSGTSSPAAVLLPVVFAAMWFHFS